MISTTRYLDLYLADTRENLRSLNRALLSIEGEGGRSAVDEAFRAVHTIKGLAASVGHERVAALAHALEDRLDAIRRSGEIPHAELVDALLGAADAVEVAIDEALRAPAAEPDGAAPAGTSPATTSGARSRRLRVRLAPDAPLPSARAMLIARAAIQSGHAASSEPADFGEDFNGEFTLVLAPGGDAEALEQLAVNAADVAALEWEVEATAAKARPVGRQVRVDANRLDVLADAVGELAILHARMESAAQTDGTASSRMTTLIRELEQATLALRMVPVGTMFDRFARLVRDAARSLGKPAEFRTEGGDIEVDRAVLEEIGEPLVHLVRNAVDHGIEAPDARERGGKPAVATVWLRAARERGGVRIEVADDGGGIDVQRVLERARSLSLPVAVPAEPRADDLLRIMAEPGFSTTDGVSDLSGRGVGLDAVVTKVRALGGSIELATERGKGTTFTLRLPITLALTPALRVRVAGGDYAVPLTHLAEVIDLREHITERHEGRETVRLRNASLPLVRLRELLGIGSHGDETAAIVAEIGERRAALAVDALVAKEPILVRAFDAPAGAHPLFAGAALLGDGRPALVLDPSLVV